MPSHHSSRVGIRETMSRAGAKHLINAIQAYWDQRGYIIELRIVEAGPEPLCCVRSDIGPRGFPPRRKPAFGVLAVEPGALQ